ncbi:MAG: phosphonate transport system permease protein, partial [Betaproteobacteria bacterium]
MNAAAPRSGPFPPNWPARLAWLGLLAYAVYAASILDFTWDRFVTGIEHGGRFVSRMFPPDTAPEKL